MIKIFLIYGLRKVSIEIKFIYRDYFNRIWVGLGCGGIIVFEFKEKWEYYYFELWL